ncbi:hypothetical protein MESS2_1000041 [Mesorhizobium metallidurans STM 2683]|uniref:Uncharacterized protein n=1 Tax=Mesorhizobium metallidurans STM 2683 TaxID=1297569 RepID=M5EFB4_9HYPH|nr:hypothetical protein MESS2_1000041 [Mesorhizobium metallidurans STM 2683]
MRRELLDPIVEVLALADADRLQRSSRSIPQTVFGVAGNDRLMIGRAAVDDDAIRSAVALQGLPEEALGCRQVAVFAEEELDRVADAVDGTIDTSIGRVS